MDLVLGVDTSCDDTGIGLVERGSGRVVANAVTRQTAVHARYGGVVPERASREHLEVVDDTLQRALSEAGAELGDVGAVGATYGPGLVGALLVGLTWGKALAWAREIPFVPVHHLEGHMASAGVEGVAGEHLCLIASGGHTSLFRVAADGTVRELGRSRDDAAGEAFDKVARLLGLPYPGGPSVSELARQGDASAVRFTKPLRNQDGYDFSFSGLKTAVATLLERSPDTRRADVAAAFEATAVDALVEVVRRAARDTGLDTVVVAGGVAANRRLRAAFGHSGLRVRVPPPELTTDNGAMIALAARARLAARPRAEDWSDWTLDAAPYLPLDEDLRVP